MSGHKHDTVCKKGNSASNHHSLGVHFSSDLHLQLCLHRASRSARGTTSLTDVFPTELAHDLTVTVSVPDAKTTGQLIQLHWPIRWKEKINKDGHLGEMTQLRTESGSLIHHTDQQTQFYQVTLRPLADSFELFELISPVGKIYQWPLPSRL